MRPLLLDLFCGAGGAAMGYHRAGFDVLGVDTRPQPRYPFKFVQADALEFLASARIGSVAAVHGSPVCKLWSRATRNRDKAQYSDQITPLRLLLLECGKPWVIENVPGAPLRPDLKLCGCWMGLPELERERWFETSWHAMELRSSCHHSQPVVVVTGHGRCRGMRGTGLAKDWRRVMGIGWMTRDELAQAIPPAYTQHIGAMLLDQLAAVTA